MNLQRKDSKRKDLGLRELQQLLCHIFCEIENVWQDKDLLYTLWKCNVQSWISNPALDRSD